MYSHVTCQVDAYDVTAPVAADADDGRVTLCRREAESEPVTVGGAPMCRREAVVQHARLIAERVRHAVCT